MTASTPLHPARRWLADPLWLLFAVAAAGLAVALTAWAGQAPAWGWPALALAGVVSALSLSGST